eukprot:3048832-Lingulodinium_polyedra.AAC.1
MCFHPPPFPVSRVPPPPRVVRRVRPLFRALARPPVTPQCWPAQCAVRSCGFRQEVGGNLSSRRHQACRP